MKLSAVVTVCHGWPGHCKFSAKSWAETEQWPNHNSKQLHATGIKRGKIGVCKSRLVVVTAPVSLTNIYKFVTEIPPLLPTVRNSPFTLKTIRLYPSFSLASVSDISCLPWFPIVPPLSLRKWRCNLISTIFNSVSHNVPSQGVNDDCLGPCSIGTGNDERRLYSQTDVRLNWYLSS